MRLTNLAGSKLLAAIGFNPNTRDMVAQFHNNGKFFNYIGVPEHTFVLVITHPASVGSAFTTYIKDGGYIFREVTAAEVEKL